MSYAVIDLGSNSIRLSVYECKDDEISKTFSHKEIAGLAGYTSKSILGATGIMKACSVLNECKEIASRFVDPSDIHLFAAASLRNIVNRDEAVSIIAQETSLIPYVLEGEEEAALGFAGATKHVNCERGVMIDVGGASTELVLIENYAAKKLVSFPMGCLNLYVHHVKEILPKEKEKKHIYDTIKGHLSMIDWGTNMKYPLLLGTGGTLRATLKLARNLFGLPPETQDFNASYVKEILDLLRDKSDNIYLKVYQSIPERLLTISTGLAILQQVIKKFGCETISVSKFGVREGYLISRVLEVNDKYSIRHNFEDN
jgi:exopolyphosphatase/guanosine-5'-triphosphate,3'-diphosphate pyrophosphatase